MSAFTHTSRRVISETLREAADRLRETAAASPNGLTARSRAELLEEAAGWFDANRVVVVADDTPGDAGSVDD